MKEPAADLPVLEFENADQLHCWLMETQHSSNGVWVRLYKKASGIACVSFDELLDEGLCFGWSESSRKAYDERSYLQKFTPRKKSGTQSARNLNRTRVLMEQGRMQPEGLKAVGLENLR